MADGSGPSRREALASAVTLAAGTVLKTQAKTIRIGVISAAIEGKPQKTNGHTWHFAQYFHPEIDLAAIKKHLDPGSAQMFENYLRHPRYSFDQLPFADTRITHVYAKPADGLDKYVEAFPGVNTSPMWKLIP